MDFKQRKDFSKLINVCDIHKLNYIGKENSLSKNWFREQNGLPGKESVIGILRKNVYNYFKNIVKATSDEALWTTFIDFKDKVKPRSFANSFLECNSRATNDYRHKSKLAYCLNRFENPFITNYFAKNGIAVNQDALATSEMLQWIWRSQIRENKPIDIYIPSLRMRSLLQDWLAGENELKVAS